MAKIQKNTIFIFLCAILTAAFFTFSVSKDGFSIWPSDSSVLIRTGLLIFIFFVYKKILSSLSFTPNIFFIILASIISAVFSFASVMGKFYYVDTWLTPIGTLSASVLFRLGLLFAGGFCFFYIMILAVSLVSGFISGRSFTGIRRISSILFDEHCFSKSLGIITLCWIPQIILRYPFVMPFDGLTSLLQYYGIKPYTTQHPIIYTLLLGHFADLGNFLGNTSIGLFLLVLLQCIVFLLVLAYTIHTMKKLGVPFWMLLTTLVLFSIAPIFSAYATTLIVDSFYDAFILLLINELVWYLFRPESYLKNWVHPVLTFVSVLGLFFRHNGTYITVILIFFTICRELYVIICKKQSIRRSLLILAVLILPLCIGKINTNLLYQKYEPEKISTRAMLAMPLQQTARYIHSHQDDLSSEELESIQKILKCSPQEWAAKYQPYSFDRIKIYFDSKASTDDITAYLKTWFKLFFRHPGTYINATFNQNYFLFSPLCYNIRYYDSITDNLDQITQVDFSTVYKDSAALQSAKETLTVCYKDLSTFPVVGLYMNQGVMDFLLLVICLYALYEKNGRLLLLGLPLLLTLAITFVGPAAYGHPRYTYPITYAMPLFFGMFLIRKNVSTSDH